MSAKHTSGPWELETEEDRFEIRMASSLGGPSRYQSQHHIEWDHSIYPDDGAQYEEALANARLIAAAPDLLEALKAARHQVALLGGEVLEINGMIVSDAIQAAVLMVIDNALAKAEGLS